MTKRVFGSHKASVIVFTLHRVSSSSKALVVYQVTLASQKAMKSTIHKWAVNFGLIAPSPFSSRIFFGLIEAKLGYSRWWTSDSAWNEFII